MSVFYSSNSGSCESFARTLASEALLYGYNATVASLDSAVQSLPIDQPLITSTASCEGRPCENVKQFVAYFESEPKPDVNYGVFGAGHHGWVNTYQTIPTYIDQAIERGEDDAVGDFFSAFDSWKENLFRKDVHGQNMISDEKLSIEIVSSSRNLAQISDVGVVVQNKVLTKATATGPEKRHLEIQLPKSQTYRAGDYLAVLPINPVEIVCRVRSAHQQKATRETCENEEEQTKLTHFMGDAYETEVLEKRISVIDILDCNDKLEDWL